MSARRIVKKKVKQRRAIQSFYPKASLFYGVFLHALLAKNLHPVITVSGEQREVYDVQRKDGDYKFFVKYAAAEQMQNETESRWVFTFNEAEIEMLRGFIAECSGTNKTVRVALVCGRNRSVKDKEPLGAEVALLNQAQFDQCLGLSEMKQSMNQRSIKVIYLKYKGLHVYGTGLDVSEAVWVARDEVDRL
jgi:hypothetical protein